MHGRMSDRLWAAPSSRSEQERIQYSRWHLSEPERGLPKDAGSTDFRMYPGGSLLNVAVDLARLGQPPHSLGRSRTIFLGNACCGRCAQRALILAF